MTFDIIGILAFGQGFEGVESGKTHFWISDVLGSMSQARLVKEADGSRKKTSKLHHQSHKTTHQGKKRPQRFHVLPPSRPPPRRRHPRLRHPTRSPRLRFRHCRLRNNRYHTRRLYSLPPCQPSALQTLTNGILDKFDKEEDICAASTGGLKYLHAVCLEALRIFAPLPLGLPRVVPQGGTIVDGYPISEGFIVSTNPYAASLSPTNFTNPQDFIPARWLGKNEKDVLDATRPVSLGNRSCLGRSLAWLEMNVALSRLVWRYSIERVGRVDWEGESRMQLLWKKPELIVRLTPRVRGEKA